MKKFLTLKKHGKTIEAFLLNARNGQRKDASESNCLSLVSNVILYWNTKKIAVIVDHLRAQWEEVHVISNGTYFSERAGMKWGSHV